MYIITKLSRSCLSHVSLLGLKLGLGLGQVIEFIFNLQMFKMSIAI